MKKIMMGVFIVASIFIIIVFINNRFNAKSEDNTEQELNEIFLETEKTSQMTMEELLTDDINDEVINDVWLRLCKLTDDGYALDHVNEYQRNYWLIYNYIGEVGNGGIEQFFYNCKELVVPTLESLEELKLTHSYKYLKEAKDIYPQHSIEIYSDEKLTDQLNRIDSTFYSEAEKECYTFFKEYLQKYREEFIKE